MIVKLRNKLGPSGNVLVILDACHSGSGTRDAGNIIRGPNGSIVSTGFEQRKKTGHIDMGVLQENKTSTSLNNAATYVSISGSQADQSNEECKDDKGNSVGSLSYSFCKALNQLPKGASYRSLFSLIQNTMLQKVPRQTPVFEGDGIDKELFANNYVVYKPYLQIEINASTKENIILKGGGIWGITVGSKVGFYDNKTFNPAGKRTLSTGVVKLVNAYTSEVVPDSLGEKLIQQNPNVFITDLAWGDQPLRLAVLDKKGYPCLEKDVVPFKKALTGFSLVEFNSKDYDLYLQADTASGEWMLAQKGSNENFAGNLSILDDKAIDNFKETLRRFDRIRYLKGLEILEPGLSARLDIVFLNGDKPDGELDTARINQHTINGRLELQQGDIVYLRMINNGDQSFYFNILDIEPDGKINRLVPNKTLRNANGVNDPLLAQDCFLNRKDTVIIRRFRIRLSPPLGNYTFKVFLSSIAFNLEDILATDDVNKARDVKPAFSKLEKLFVNSKVNTEGKRDVETISTMESGSMFNYNFILKAKKK
jgi:hypothetical protein